MRGYRVVVAVVVVMVVVVVVVRSATAAMATPYGKWGRARLAAGKLGLRDARLARDCAVTGARGDG